MFISGDNGISIFNPEDCEFIKFVNSRYPVNSCCLSPLAYREKDPMFHLIYSGGIPKRDQAKQSEGGNQIFFYDLLNQKEYGFIAISQGINNDLNLFNDGSGLITAGE